MKLFIKNMVCDRCKMAVKAELGRLGLQPASVELGEVDLEEQALKPEILNQLRTNLQDLGFDIIDDKKSRLIEKIKNLVIEMIHHTEEPENLKYSELISRHLHYDYPYLSRLFSETEGVTIEQYIINQKTEKAKEYLVYDELSVSELAWKLNYSSVAHFSGQFKKVTGMTPSQFKSLHEKKRKPLDEV